MPFPVEVDFNRESEMNLYDETRVFEVVESRREYQLILIILIAIVALIIGVATGLWMANNPDVGFLALQNTRDWTRRLMWICTIAGLGVGIAVMIWREEWFEEIFSDNSLIGKASKLLNIRKGLLWLLFMCFVLLYLFKSN